MSAKKFQMTLAGRPLVIETGHLAQFASGSCLVRYGDTVILSTVTASATPRPGIDYFPLSVDYEEKMYSVGKIPGGFIKREGRPTEKAILTSRVIDRPIRPLFPKDLRNDCRGQQPGPVRRPGLFAGNRRHDRHIDRDRHFRHSLERSDRRCPDRSGRRPGRHQPQ